MGKKSSEGPLPDGARARPERRAVLIFNPASGAHRSARAVPALVSTLGAGGFAVEPRATAGPGDATRLAREAVAAGGLEAVFALGGDGTLREVAAGTLDSGVAVGFLPAGTANVMALALGLPRTARAAAARASQLVPRAFDVGWCGELPFLMMVSAGLDAAVMAEQSPRLKKRFGRAAVILAALVQWWRYRFPAIEVCAGGDRQQARHVVASNIPFYGGRARMAPAADPADGALELMLSRDRGRLAALGFARDLLLGRHLRRATVATRRATSLVLGGGAPTLLLQLDGDAVRLPSPVTIRVERGRLRLLAAP